MNREQLIEYTWSNIEPSLKGYSGMIERLLSFLSNEQLVEFAKTLE